MANLVFKFNWDHRPFPYNSAQGKRQFMLPFASGIPNLAPAFSQITNIPNINPASRVVGTAVGNVMEVGAFGLGLLQDTKYISTTDDLSNVENGFYSIEQGGHAGILIRQAAVQGKTLMGIIGFPSDPVSSAPFYYKINLSNGKTLQSQQAYKYVFRTTQNTAVDGNGFIKAASPIVKLFAYKIELNDDASKQSLDYEKVGTGDYLLKGSLGFAQEGWYIEVPKDANGNTVVAVEYSTLENGDLSIKTYKRKFDFELAAVIADHENPMDIPEGRWIDIRLHEEPEPEPEIIQTETPVEFQPTNLSEAVAAAMAGVEPPEISDTDETL
ncbi:phage tail protein [Acinetobacter nosocomialis]|uniref:phage tail fiber protein n=1 Tax=Acinetobacter calcoaceticus/baumannii complex TaxID=909768 RepID=UPI00044C433C|nr:MULTISPECIES: hypothetical protein [Acinetobacter calcoaceticus/baumannii complex]EXE72326.1 hypothetical protein J582_3528 [Acinetobacter sp. 1566109]MBJ9962139.1 phage tail protein [Acinetobacter nosocomialis]MBR7751541.1 phage tail protein [Acinetobacter nosocomialis]OTL13292.1 phage tail protein [Acinetobacter nosocomialis]HEM7454350.1 phage tail protein [Acinetobacter nosocomialis]